MSAEGGGQADPDPAGLKSIAARTEQVQSSARWLIGALAGVGALLVPGLGLTKLGTLDGTRLGVAIAALAVALLAAIVTIIALGRFLRAGHLSLGDLVERERKGDDPLIAYLARNPELLREQATSLEQLERLYLEAHEELAGAQRRASKAGPSKAELRLAAAAERLTRLEAVETAVMDAARLAGHPDLTLGDLANVQRTRGSSAPGAEPPKPGTTEALAFLAKHPALLAGEAETLDQLRDRLLDARAEVLELEAGGVPAGEHPTVEQAEARVTTLRAIVRQIEPAAGLEDLNLTFRRRIWVAVLPMIVAVAMGAFVWAANEPPVDRNDLSGVTLRGADLSGANLEHADLSQTTFVDSNLEDADLDGADLEGTRFVSSRCPDGFVTAAGAGSRCTGHLKILKPPDIRPTTRRERGGDGGG